MDFIENGVSAGLVHRCPLIGLTVPALLMILEINFGILRSLSACLCDLYSTPESFYITLIEEGKTWKSSMSVTEERRFFEPRSTYSFM